MKFCSKCNIVKEYCEFSKDSSKKDGLYSSCKKCVNESKKLYYIKNKEKCKKRSIEYINKNIERIREIKRKYSRSIKGKENNKNYRIKFKDNIAKNKRLWSENNVERIKGYKSKYRKNNGDRIRKSESYKKYRIKWKKQRLLDDPLFLLKERISSLIRNSTKHNYKNTKSKDILGINIENFKIYIENQFKDGMSWNNYGKWQLDHKVPISIANNKEEFYKLNHYTNFRPMWKIDNIKKSNKILEEFKELKNTLLNFCN